jgi:hypothetical protein
MSENRISKQVMKIEKMGPIYSKPLSLKTNLELFDKQLRVLQIRSPKDSYKTPPDNKVFQAWPKNEKMLHHSEIHPQ